MDLLTDSQLRLINEFRERVKQSEKRLRETIQNKDSRNTTANYSTNDDSFIKQNISREYKHERSDSYASNKDNSFSKGKVPPLEDKPQRLLKPIVFNGNSSIFFL